MTTWQALKTKTIPEDPKQTTLITRTCKWCGTLFIKTSNKTTYCKPECKKYAHMEQKAIFANIYRRQHPKRECLGTGGLSQHRRQTHTSEYNEIQNEKKRLKIT